MLYTVYDTVQLKYSVFDPYLNLVSRWKPHIADATLADSYSISGHWAQIHGKSHAELIAYFNTHDVFKLIDTPSANSTYEYW